MDLDLVDTIVHTVIQRKLVLNCDISHIVNTFAQSGHEWVQPTCVPVYTAILRTERPSACLQPLMHELAAANE